ncbi:hypothetical protein [Marinitoga sp. 1137]|uniref:hypothetical protein n=1 Tax=Marinitoga sp. 1137 TaxID=1545835 RepID=UPI000952862C|nr:hypothetical protein [Marinitoga sp. 1137]
MKKFLVFLFVFYSIMVLSAKFNFGIDLEFNNIKEYQKVIFEFVHDYEGFNFIIELNALNDGKYKPSQPDVYYKGFYFYMKNGGVLINKNNYEISFGRLQHSDIVDSPYSLFISSKKNSAIILDFEYEDKSFFYESRYIELNRESTIGYPDRGANFKNYGIKIGNFRLGYEESIVYVGTSFDIEYFVNPIPNFFIQYINISSGKPWTHGYNANSILGFMVDYLDKNKYLYGQILVDDINTNRIFAPNSYQNPDKIAWSLGGKISTKFGKLGIYNAGATKYTFEPYGNENTNTKYGYTYYPDVIYKYGGEKTIPLEENYIGYINGENNLSFMITYENIINNINLKSNFEYSISGSKSPANPWHELLNWDELGKKSGTKFLDGERLEHKCTFNLFADYEFLGIKFMNELTLKYTKNKLKLVSPENLVEYNEIKYFVPSDNSEISWNLLLGFEVSF